MAMHLDDSVIVVTGASSGIGRATAHALARRGASLILVSRGGEDLEEAAEECRRLGGQAQAIPTDMADEAQVRELADRSLTGLGRIDGWINNAAVTLFGRIEEVPIDAYRRVIETNLMGYVHGARAAIPIFREQGRGVLVNVSSIAGCIGQPYASAYVSSKFAIRGLSECLRMELEDAPDIHVCTVMPGVVDTPLYQHAANYSGREIRPPGEAHAAAEVAECIVEVLSDPRSETFVAAHGKLLELARLVAPDMTERRAAERVEHRHFKDRAAQASAGNLFEARPGAVSGGWRRPVQRRGARPFGGAAMRTAGLVALAAIPLGYLAWRQAQGRA